MAKNMRNNINSPTITYTLYASLITHIIYISIIIR